MLRVIFTERDLSLVRVAAAPDPLWEITNSLDRLQTSRGRWAYARWHRSTRDALADQPFQQMVSSFLLPLFPRAAYFPDFLTPAAAIDGLEAGIDAILGTPPERVTSELQTLAQVHHAPDWAPRLADDDLRADLGAALRTYHQKVIEPYCDTIDAALEGDRAMRTRALQRGGVDRLLASYWPMMRWRSPVLEVNYPLTKTIHLDGRGLLLTPSYFCWQYPVALADDELPPVLIYPLLHELSEQPEVPEESPAALIGATRTAILQTVNAGRTVQEIAQQVGISVPATNRHLDVLRDSGLIASHPQGQEILHVLTPLGAALLTRRAPE
ncbi:MAG: hypothetical protein QOG10_4514 [Kribbellaceae bacterium]|nr:hypothetical protein [Kribbellaceae bacterium]